MGNFSTDVQSLKTFEIMSNLSYLLDRQIMVWFSKLFRVLRSNIDPTDL